MNDDEIINGILKEVKEYEPKYHTLQYYVMKFNIDDLNRQHHIFEKMKNEGLIIANGTTNVLLQSDGRNIITKEGGYIEWAKRQRKLEESEYHKKIREGVMAKWQINTFWWLFALAILGFAISLYNLFIKK